MAGKIWKELLFNDEKSCCQQSRIQNRLFPPFLPSLFSLSSPNLTTDITFVHLRSFTFFSPSQIAGCYVNVSQNPPRLHPATVTGCFHYIFDLIGWFCVGSSKDPSKLHIQITEEISKMALASQYVLLWLSFHVIKFYWVMWKHCRVNIAIYEKLSVSVLRSQISRFWYNIFF